MPPTKTGSRDRSPHPSAHRTWAGYPCPLHEDHGYPLDDPPGATCPGCVERLRLLTVTHKRTGYRRYREAEAICVNQDCRLHREPLIGWTWDEDGTAAEQTWQFWDTMNGTIPDGYREQPCRPMEPTDTIWPERDKRRDVDTEKPRLDPDSFSERYYRRYEKRKEAEGRPQSSLDDHASDRSGAG